MRVRKQWDNYGELISGLLLAFLFFWIVVAIHSFGYMKQGGTFGDNFPRGLESAKEYFASCMSLCEERENADK